MNKRHNNSTRASALQMIFSITLLCGSAIWLAIAAPTNLKKALERNALPSSTQKTVNDLATSASALVLSQWRWAISMAMASKTSSCP